MDNFDVWLHQTFMRTNPQTVLRGFKVKINPITNATELTAEQVTRLAAWLRVLAFDDPTENEPRKE